MSYRDELDAARARIQVLEDEMNLLRAKVPSVSIEQLREGHERALARIRSLERDVQRLLAVLFEVSGRRGPIAPAPSSFPAKSLEGQVAALVDDSSKEAEGDQPVADAGNELDRVRELARRAIVTYVESSSTRG